MHEKPHEQMKKSLLTLVPALAIIALTTTSCADDCCTFLTAKICESDLPVGYPNWAAYKAELENQGYSCD
jgi:hypothetical protein